MAPAFRPLVALACIAAAATVACAADATAAEAAAFRAGIGAAAALPVGANPDNAVALTTCLPDAFVKVTNGKFTIDGAPFVFAGWNQWEVLEAASNAPAPFRHLRLPGKEMIVRLMNQGVATGMKVMRLWAHTITEGFATQTAPGVWNEDILLGFDFVIDQAHRRGLKLIIALVDNW